MNTIPSFPKLRRIFMAIGFLGVFFLIGLLKWILL